MDKSHPSHSFRIFGRKRTTPLCNFRYCCQLAVDAVGAVAVGSVVVVDVR